MNVAAEPKAPTAERPPLRAALAASAYSFFFKASTILSKSIAACAPIPSAPAPPIVFPAIVATCGPKPDGAFQNELLAAWAFMRASIASRSAFAMDCSIVKPLPGILIFSTA